MMKARDIGRDIVADYVADPVEAQVRLIQLIRTKKVSLVDATEDVEAASAAGGMTMAEKAKIAETLSAYWMAEILGRPDVKELLTTLRTGDGYNPLFWALWPGFVKRPVAGWEPTMKELVQTINVMFEIGWSPLDLNKKGENIVQSMRLAKTSGYLGEIDCDALYDILMHPPRNVCAGVCNSSINKCTLPTIGTYIIPIRWVISQTDGMEIFATSVVASALKTYHGAKQNGFYAAVHNVTECARLLLSGKAPADASFDRFFAQHPWNAAAMIAQFRRIVISECFETSFVSTGGDEDGVIVATNRLGEFPSTQYALDAIGAIIGEIGSDVDRNAYMRMCLDRGGHLLMHFTVCLIHSARQKCADWMTRFAPTLSTLKDNADKITGFSLFMILNAIQPHCGRTLCSMEDLFPELATVPKPVAKAAPKPAAKAAPKPAAKAAPKPVVEVLPVVAEIVHGPTPDDWEDDAETKDGAAETDVVLNDQLYRSAPNISSFLRAELAPSFKISVSAAGEMNVTEGDDALYSVCGFLRKNPTEDAYIAFICRTAELVLRESDFGRVNIVLQEAVRQTRSKPQYQAALSKLRSCDFGRLVDCGPEGTKLPAALIL
jgi:hypothetical protein